MPSFSDTAELQLGQFRSSGIICGDYPGYVCVVSQDEGKLRASVEGNRQSIPHEIRIETDSIFDLPSLTKSTATATLTLMAIKSEYLHEWDNIADLLLEASFFRSVTMPDSLVHRFGLLVWILLYQTSRSKEESIPKLFQIRHQMESRKKELYSDLEYILSGHIIEKVLGKDLRKLSKEMIFSLIIMNKTCHEHSQSLIRGAVVTELTKNGYPLIGKVYNESASVMEV